MRRAVVTILAFLLAFSCLTACGKKNTSEGETVKKVEVNNSAEKGTGTDRKYEDATKEPVTAPERNKDTTDNVNSGDAETNADGEEYVGFDREPSIYGVWYTADFSNLTIFNSPVGIKFNMYESATDSYTSGDVTTDGTSYIELKYLKPVVEPETVESTEETQEETHEEISYASLEEYEAAVAARMEAEEKELYETVRYSIDKNEYNSETHQMFLTITGNNKTYEFSADINEYTPDYSLEDNSLAADTVLIETEQAAE